MDFDRESGTVAGADHIRNNTGWYVQQQFELWNRLNVSAGGRLENNTTFGTRANPKVGLSFRALPAHVCALLPEAGSPNPHIPKTSARARFIRRPKHSGDLVLTWIERKWTARWATRAVGRRADSDFFAYAIPNSLTSNPGYSISDATFTYDFARPISAFVRLDNVFNRDYQEVLGYLALRRAVVVGTRIRIGGPR